ILAGALDTTVANALTPEQAQGLKERWEASGDGRVLTAPGNSQLIAFQFSPELQTEQALLDPRVRQALFYAIDMQSWTDRVIGGDPGRLLEAGGRRVERLRDPSIPNERPRVLAGVAERRDLLTRLWRGDSGSGRVPPERDAGERLQRLQSRPLLQPGHGDS